MASYQSTKVRLNIMMFLEYAVKGLWFPLASVFLTASTANGGLGFKESEKGLIVAIPFAIGAILSPFVGQLCDRRFATEKCLGVMLFLTGILMLITAHQTEFAAWLALGSAFAILYVPTVGLTNSLAMGHLKDSKKEFPFVRVWGTFGWIAVAWVFPMVWLQQDLNLQWKPPFLKGTDYPDVAGRMIDSVKVAGVTAMAYGLFCWFNLPHTPPSRDKAKGLALLRALDLFKKPSFAILMVASLIIASIHTMYFIQMGSFLKTAGLDGSDIMPAMSIGQISELVVMPLLGLVLTRLGFRWCISFGALAYALRYFVFSQSELPVGWFVFAQIFHGVCFACFFAASFIYVDRIAPKDIRHSAQTLYTLVMFGLGPIIASQLNTLFAKWSDTVDGKLTISGYGTYWLFNAGIALVVFILFALFFRDETETSAKTVSKTA